MLEDNVFPSFASGDYFLFSFNFLCNLKRNVGSVTSKTMSMVVLTIVYTDFRPSSLLFSESNLSLIFFCCVSYVYFGIIFLVNCSWTESMLSAVFRYVIYFYRDENGSHFKPIKNNCNTTVNIESFTTKHLNTEHSRSLCECVCLCAYVTEKYM